ncbi:MAG: 4Fe-4S binding protein [Anaerolineae bacterium]|nr:4Fe-4S binding protein [Anaerolineae bacterium]
MSTLNQLAEALGKISDRSPGLERESCINQRHLRAGQCDSCAAACPVDAITLTPVPQIDSTACLACGACVAACPSEALQGRRTVVETWRAARQTAVNHAGAAFVCQAVSGEQFAAARVPCMSALPAEVYIALAAAGVQRAVVYTADCTACPLAASLAQAERALADAEAVLNVLDLSVQVTAKVGRPPLAETRATGVSRRDFLSAFLKRPPEKPDMGDDVDHFLTAGIKPRRALLLEALNRVPIPEAAQMAASPNHWGLLEASQDCIGCPMCAELCPTGALTLTEHEGDASVQLRFNPAGCTACGLCVRACFKHALSWQDSLPLKALAADQDMLLWEGRAPADPLKSLPPRRRP